MSEIPGTNPMPPVHDSGILKEWESLREWARSEDVTHTATRKVPAAGWTTPPIWRVAYSCPRATAADTETQSFNPVLTMVEEHAMLLLLKQRVAALDASAILAEAEARGACDDQH